MRKLLFVGGCMLALATSALTANAADIARRGPTKEPRYVSPIYNWTGAYIGINGGYGWGDSSFNGPFASPSFNVDGGTIGGTLGYNWQIGQTVLGIEGDLNWANIRGSGLCTGALACSTKTDWLGTLRGRAGYAIDRFMPYVTGGLAVGNIDTTIAGVGSANETKAGWTLGGGVEAALWGNVTAKIEYLYVDLGRGGSILGSEATSRNNLVRAGVNFRF